MGMACTWYIIQKKQKAYSEKSLISVWFHLFPPALLNCFSFLCILPVFPIEIWAGKNILISPFLTHTGQTILHFSLTWLCLHVSA